MCFFLLSNNVWFPFNFIHKLISVWITRVVILSQEIRGCVYSYTLSMWWGMSKLAHRSVHIRYQLVYKQLLYLGFYRTV